MIPVKISAFLLAVTAIAISSSCGQSGDVIFLGANHQFVPQDEEYMSPGDRDEIDEYSDCCNILPDAQVPLYRVFQGKNYTVFLGIPVDRSPDLLASDFLNLEDKSFKLAKEYDNFRLLEHRNSDYCLNIFLFTLHENDHFMVAFKSESESLCEQANTREWLTDRIEEL